MRPQTYNFKLIDFLATRNTVKIESEDDLEKLRKILTNVGLGNILYGEEFESYHNLRQLAKLNNHSKDDKMLICLEYDNARGITFYTNDKEPTEWYGCPPFSVKELVSEL